MTDPRYYRPISFELRKGLEEDLEERVIEIERKVDLIMTHLGLQLVGPYMYTYTGTHVAGTENKSEGTGWQIDKADRILGEEVARRYREMLEKYLPIGEVDVPGDDGIPETKGDEE